MNRFYGASKVKSEKYGIGYVYDYTNNDVEVYFDLDDESINIIGDEMEKLEVVERKAAVVERIVAKKLFSRIDHDINFDSNQDIGIVIAPNGCGKTTMFKFIDFMCNPSEDKFKKLNTIPFESFTIFLNDGYAIKLEKKPIPEEKKPLRLRAKQKYILQFGDETDYESHIIDAIDVVHDIKQYPFKYSIMRNDIVKRELEFTYTPSNNEASHDVARLVGASDSMELNSLLGGLGKTAARLGSIVGDIVALKDLRECIIDMKEQLRKNKIAVQIDYIATDRLRYKRFSKNETSNNSASTIINSSVENEIDYLVFANREIRRKLQKAILEYNRQISFGKVQLSRVYLHTSENAMEPFESFESEWEKYNSEIMRYVEIGLLEESDANPLKVKDIRNAYSKKGAFLNVYLNVFKNTLKPLREIYDDIKLLADIFNERNVITGKVLKFTRNGMEVFCDNEKLDLDCLSSGEKNDLALFYRLIFEEKETTVMVDEPEISLHIEWQESFLDRLSEICKRKNIRAIVATHSPNIINGHFEYLAEKR